MNEFEYLQLDKSEFELVNKTKSLLLNLYHPTRHTVSAGILTTSGKYYISVNVSSHSYNSHAEPIALGMAISNGEKEFETIVAVEMLNGSINVVELCGSCRQLLNDYAANIKVIINHQNSIAKLSLKELLPFPYISKRAKE